MRHPVPGAALTALLIILTAAPALADIVDLTDGVDGFRRPRKIKSAFGSDPSDDNLRASGKGNLKLAYDTCEIAGKAFSAAQLVEAWVLEALMNENFNRGEQNGAAGYYPESAEAFRMAAQELSGAAQQIALYKRMLALANTNAVNATLTAANQVIKSAEKPYYFGPAQEMRAKILWKQGKKNDALTALRAVTSAPGMNIRDRYSAQYLSAWLSKSVGADSAEKWKAAEQLYRKLLTDIEREPGRSRPLAQVPRFKILMSLGEALRAQGQADASKKLFDEILGASTEATDKSILAGVYYGLGDVAYEEASQLQAKGTRSPATREAVNKLLDMAALHYLRVVLLYRPFAGQRELFGATLGAAKVFESLFQLSGEKDCDLARRSYDYYVQAVQMQQSGEAKRILVREGRALKQKIDTLCTEDE